MAETRRDGSEEITPLGTRTLHASLETGAFRIPSARLELRDEDDRIAIPGFRISHRLGEGGMGVVYRAFQESMRREVALKVISPQQARDRGFCERFLREARAAGAVNHPNLVSCYDVGEADGHLYMVCEVMDGGDAARLAIRNGGRLDEARALRIAMDCCHGLAALHRAGIVHRDVKPANIYLAIDGTAKLGDFGLARATGSDHLTRTGTPVGTPAFMAPEQVRGESGLDGRADLYALGASLYALLTGAAPFSASSPWGVLVSVLNDQAPDVCEQRPSLPAELGKVIARAMSKSRDDRPSTAEEMLVELEAIARGLPDARPPSVRRSLPSPMIQSSADAPTLRMPPGTSPAAPRRWRGAAALALGAVSSLAVALAWPAPTAHAAGVESPTAARDERDATDAAARWQASLRGAGFACAVHERADGTLALVAQDPAITDLTLLIGVPLTHLDLSGCRRLAGELSALTGMRLRSLRLAGCTALESLNGIQGMPLEELDASGCAALDGAPVQLRGMPLRRLSLAGCTRLTGLDGLQGMPLEQLDLTGCAALRGDLLALRGTRLAHLDIEGCARLTSLDGIESLPLKRLRLADCRRLADLSPLTRLVGCEVVHEPKPAAAEPVNATVTRFDW